MKSSVCTGAPGLKYWDYLIQPKVKSSHTSHNVSPSSWNFGSLKIENKASSVSLELSNIFLFQARGRLWAKYLQIDYLEVVRIDNRFSHTWTLISKLNKQLCKNKQNCDWNFAIWEDAVQTITNFTHIFCILGENESHFLLPWTQESGKEAEWCVVTTETQPRESAVSASLPQILLGHSARGQGLLVGPGTQAVRSSRERAGSSRSSVYILGSGPPQQNG